MENIEENKNENAEIKTAIVESTPLVTPTDVTTTEVVAPITSQVVEEKTVVYPHQELLEEEKIDYRTLPNEIGSKIRGWAMMMTKHKANPTDKMATSLIKQSVVIADMITDHLEKELPEKPVVPVDNRKDIDNDTIVSIVEKGVKEKKSDDEIINPIVSEYKTTKEVVAVELDKIKQKIKKETVFVKPPPRPLTIEQKVFNALDNDGRIRYDKLGEIIGKKVGLGRVQAGTLTLENIYMTNYFIILE